MFLPLRAFVRALSTPALVLAGAPLCGALAGGLFVSADSLNIAAPFWWTPLALILMAVVWLARRVRPAAAALLAGYGIAGGVLFAPLLHAATGMPREPALGPSIRIVTFNMFRANPRGEEAAEWILRQDPDFVILLEASPFNLPAVERLQERLPYVYDCSARSRCSTMLFARKPAKEVWPLAQGDADNRRALSALTGRFAIGHATIPITAVHLARPWPLGHQAGELEELAVFATTVGRSGIMVGDFNSAPWTFAMRRLAAAGELVLASGSTGSWPASLPAAFRLPLDQIYVGPCLMPAEVRRGPAFGSDHLPLVADIVLGRCNG